MTQTRAAMTLSGFAKRILLTIALISNTEAKNPTSFSEKINVAESNVRSFETWMLAKEGITPVDFYRTLVSVRKEGLNKLSPYGRELFSKADESLSFLCAYSRREGKPPSSTHRQAAGLGVGLSFGIDFNALKKASSRLEIAQAIADYSRMKCHPDSYASQSNSPDAPAQARENDEPEESTLKRISRDSNNPRQKIQVAESPLRNTKSLDALRSIHPQLLLKKGLEFYRKSYGETKAKELSLLVERLESQGGSLSEVIQAIGPSLGNSSMRADMTPLLNAVPSSMRSDVEKFLSSL